MNIPKTGQAGSVGLVVTKTLVILGDRRSRRRRSHPRGAMLRAYDKTDRQRSRRGVDAGAAKRLADDVHGRRQAVHRRRGQRRQYSGEYLAFSLPAIETRTSGPD